LPCSIGDHLGTTRYPCSRTTRRWPPVMCAGLNASELRRRLLPRSGGQGVAGSNPAVPTQVRRLIANPETAFWVFGTKIVCVAALVALLDRWSSEAGCQ